MLEVEIKADLGELKKEAIQGSAAEMGFVPADSLQEIDIYFNGNDRNFIKTDEALRLRSCRNLTTGAPRPLSPTKDLSWTKNPAHGRNTKPLSGILR